MTNPVAAQASTLEKLQKGDISGFVEEVSLCQVFISPTSMQACMHACHLKVSAAYLNWCNLPACTPSNGQELPCLPHNEIQSGPAVTACQDSQSLKRAQAV